MEESRLKPMKENYDPKLFNDYYERTEALRNKLAFGIDARRFGVDHAEIKSWFDVKFIYVYNKYHGVKSDEMLLGYILNSLKLFKTRIIKAAYTVKNSQNIVSTDNELYIENKPDEDNSSEFFNAKLSTALSFLKENLSENAYQVLDIQLNPPPYILNKLREMGIKNTTKIPNSLYAEYFELGVSPEAINFIAKLHKEIRNGIKLARSKSPELLSELGD